jgi:hypothetical protein
MLLRNYFLASAGPRVIFIDRYTISVIEKRDGKERQVGIRNVVEKSTKSRVRVGIYERAFLYRRDGNPGGWVSRFGFLIPRQR